MSSFFNYNKYNKIIYTIFHIIIFTMYLILQITISFCTAVILNKLIYFLDIFDFNLIFAFDRTRLITTTYYSFGDSKLLSKLELPVSFIIYEKNSNDIILYANEILFDFLNHDYPDILFTFLTKNGFRFISKDSVYNQLFFFTEPFIEEDNNLPKFFQKELENRFNKEELEILVEELKKMQNFFKLYKSEENYLNVKLNILEKRMSVAEINDIKKNGPISDNYTKMLYNKKNIYKGHLLESTNKIIYFKDKTKAFDFIEENNSFYFKQIQNIFENKMIDYILYYNYNIRDENNNIIDPEKNPLRYHYIISNTKGSWYTFLADSFKQNKPVINNNAMFYHFGLYYSTLSSDAILPQYLEAFTKNKEYFEYLSAPFYNIDSYIVVEQLYRSPRSHIYMFIDKSPHCDLSCGSNGYHKSINEAFYLCFPNYGRDSVIYIKNIKDNIINYINYIKHIKATFNLKELIKELITSKPKIPFDVIHFNKNLKLLYFDVFYGINNKLHELHNVSFNFYNYIKDSLINTYYKDMNRSPDKPRCLHFGHHKMFIIEDDPWMHWDFKAMHKAHNKFYIDLKNNILYYFLKFNDYCNYLNNEVKLLKPYEIEKIKDDKKNYYNFNTFVYIYKQFAMQFNCIKYNSYYTFKIDYLKVISYDIYNYIKSYIPHPSSSISLDIEDNLPKKKRALPYKVHYVNYDIEIVWNNTNIYKHYNEIFKEYSETLKKYNRIIINITRQYSYIYYNLRNPVIQGVNISIDYIKQNYNNFMTYFYSNISPRLKEAVTLKLITDHDIMTNHTSDPFSNSNKIIPLARLTIIDFHAFFIDLNYYRTYNNYMSLMELSSSSESSSESSSGASSDGLKVKEINFDYKNVETFFFEYINNNKKNEITKEEIDIFNYLKKDIDEISKNYEKIHFERFKVSKELLNINIQSNIFMYINDFNVLISNILLNIQKFFNYFINIQKFIIECYNIFFIEKTYMNAFADYFRIWDERIQDYHHDKFPPLLYLLDKETMVSEEDFFYMVINEMPAGDGGCYNRQLFKKHHAYNSVVNYVTILNKIEQDVETYQYMRRFLQDLKKTSDAFFPGLDLRIVQQGAASNAIETLGAVEQYLGFESTIETYRDDDRRFYKYDTWYHNSRYLSNMTKLLSRSGQIKSSLNMHRDLVVDDYINYLLNNDKKYNNLHGFLHSDLVNLLFNYIPYLYNLFDRAYNLYYEITYYGDDYDFLIKSNKEGLAYNATKFLPYSFFTLYYNQPKNPHEEYVLDTFSQIVDDKKILIEQSERLNKNLESQIKKYYPNIGADMKANFTKYMNYLYRKYLRMMDDIPTLNDRLRDPLISELFNRRSMYMLDNYFFDPTIEFNSFLEELDFKYPHTYKYQFTLGRYDPHASYKFRSRFTDELNALNMAYVENFLEVYEVWIGCKFEFLAHTLHQNLPIKTFTDTLIYKVFFDISPELCYYLGYLYYSFLIFAYKFLVADAFLFLMFEVLYKLNTSNFFYAFSGYFLYVFICILGLSSCIFLVSNVGQRSSTILRLIAFESALVSFMMAILLMHIRQQQLDELLDETTDWATFRMFIFYTLEENPLFYYFGKSFWTLFFILFCLLAFECAFGLILIIIAYNKITHFTKAYYAYNKPEYIHVDLGYGAEYDIASSKFFNYFSSGIDTDHIYRNGYGKIELSPSDIYNDFISDDVKKYVEKKQEKDIKEFEKKYENK